MQEIESAFNDHEMKIMSDELRREYQRQLENIRNLKTLYEERTRVIVTERDTIKRELEETKSELTVEMERYIINNIYFPFIISFTHMDNNNYPLLSNI